MAKWHGVGGARLRRTAGMVGAAAVAAMVGLVPAAIAGASGASSGDGVSGGQPEVVKPDSVASMTRLLNVQLHGGYVAAGVAMRDLGYGKIHLSGIPAGSTVEDAYLLWDVLGGTARTDAPARDLPTVTTLDKGRFDGSLITGTLVATGADPCWGTITANYSFEADVTEFVDGNGTYDLSDFASGTTNGTTPGFGDRTFPLLEGASLVVVYKNTSSATTDVQLYAGATETTSENALTLTMTGFTVGTTPTAKTTFIVADGQTAPDAGGTFNDTQVVTTFTGATPQTVATYATGNLWDTRTATVSSLVTARATSATAHIYGSDDCLVWVGQAFSTTTTIVTVTPTPSIHHHAPPPVRIWGTTATGTSIAASQKDYGAQSAQAVVLAQNGYFSDALTGGPLAARVHGPLLLTTGASARSTLNPLVAAEIERILPQGKTVYVLGGPEALSPDIDAQLVAMGYVPDRIAGSDEYATAVAIAEAMGNPSTIFEATGLTFSDSLSAVPAAIKDQGAILLTDGATQAPETAAYLAAYPGDSRYAIGGPLAAAGADPQATAVYGLSAGGTSAAVATRFFGHSFTFGIAAQWPDGMDGGVFMAVNGRLGPMLIVSPTVPLNHTIAAYLGRQAPSTQGYVFGGPLAVSPAVVAAVQAAVG